MDTKYEIPCREKPITHYTDVDRFLEYVFKSGRNDVVERIIEMARQESNKNEGHKHAHDA